LEEADGGIAGLTVILVPEKARWLEGWPLIPWRDPDKFEKFRNHFQAVWYSDDENPDNSSYAYMVEMNPETFIVTQYIHSSEWDYELPDDMKEPPHWKMRIVEFVPGSIYKIILEKLREEAMAKGTPASRVRPPRGQPKLIAGYTMAIANIYMGHHESDEDVAYSLP
jgi:hypothetical protein